MRFAQYAATCRGSLRPPAPVRCSARSSLRTPFRGDPPRTCSPPPHPPPFVHASCARGGGGGGGAQRACACTEQRLAPGGRAALPLTRTRPIARISLRAEAL